MKSGSFLFDGKGNFQMGLGQNVQRCNEIHDCQMSQISKRDHKGQMVLMDQIGHLSHIAWMKSIEYKKGWQSQISWKGQIGQICKKGKMCHWSRGLLGVRMVDADLQNPHTSLYLNILLFSLFNQNYQHKAFVAQFL